MTALAANLAAILAATAHMPAAHDDPEMLLDLMYQVAACYQACPAVRLVWLQHMAQRHVERQHLAEAAQCLVHAAALVAEYLAVSKNVTFFSILFFFLVYTMYRVFARVVHVPCIK